MYKTIQILEKIGQSSSLRQHQTLQEMLNEQNISEQEIQELIDTNTPLICAWIPENDEPEQEENDNDQTGSKQKLKHQH